MHPDAGLNVTRFCNQKFQRIHNLFDTKAISAPEFVNLFSAPNLFWVSPKCIAAPCRDMAFSLVPSSHSFGNNILRSSIALFLSQKSSFCNRYKNLYRIIGKSPVLPAGKHSLNFWGILLLLQPFSVLNKLKKHIWESTLPHCSPPCAG